jgi:hypothetical protein
MALCALHEAGISPEHDGYRKGVSFLLKNQYRDGAWLVKTRAFPVQPYFESGYPIRAPPMDFGRGRELGFPSDRPHTAGREEPNCGTPKTPRVAPAVSVIDLLLPRAGYVVPRAATWRNRREYSHNQ